MLLNKRLIYPPLFDHISKQAVKQSRVRTRLYRQMQYTFLACNLARNGDGWCFTRVYEDDARWWQLIIGNSFFLLAAGLALYVRSEERRGGQECVITCSSGMSQ